METKKLYEVLVELVHEDKEYEVGSFVELYSDEAMAFEGSVKLVDDGDVTPKNEDGSEAPANDVKMPEPNTASEANTAPVEGENKDEAPAETPTDEPAKEENTGWAGNHEVGKE